MSGETHLATLLGSMSPKLMSGEYVFLTFESASYGEHVELRPIASFVETEGLTLVVPRDLADQAGLNYDVVLRGITLAVHSSLEAVGLTAAVSRKLTEHNISANVIAGFYHDHIFVHTHVADKALTALQQLTAEV